MAGLQHRIAALAITELGEAIRDAMQGRAAIVTGVCAVYLVRLAATGRRDASGIAGFALFGSWAVALIVLLILR